MSSRRRVCSASALLIAVAVMSATAAPVVEIKSRAKLQLDGVLRAGDDQVVVTGRLFDPVTSLGLASNSVEIRIDGETAMAVTDGDGRFEVELPASSGIQNVELAFPGNASLDPAATVRETADPSLQPVVLTMEARPTAAGVVLVVTATAAEHELAAPISLFADRVGDPRVVPLTTTTSGREIEVTRKQLGGAGSRHFRADFAGDTTHQPASVTKSYEFTATSKTELSVSVTALAYEDTLTATGTVLDEDAIALAGAEVTLVSRDRRLAQGVTGIDGSYRFRIEGEILGAGRLELQTLTEPGGAIEASRSELVVVQVSVPQPVPITYTVIAFLATGFAAGAFFAGRSKPWRRFARPTAPADQDGGNSEAHEGGLVTARPSLVATLRRANEFGFAGAVRDTVRGRAIAAAVVTVSRRPDGAPARDRPSRSRLAAAELAADPEKPLFHDERRTISGDDGSFSIEDLIAGTWKVEVTATAHVRTSFEVVVPHRGELSGVRVDLVPVREKVFLLYQKAAMPMLPDPKLWGVWSPRQVVDHVRALQPSAALLTLTDFVEEVYFSARPAEEAVLPITRTRVEAAMAERTSPR